MKTVRINAIGENSSSTERWNDVPHGTMDEVRSYVRLDLPVQSAGKAAAKIVPLRPRTPCWKGLCADSEEKREPVSDIDTAVVDSLKVLDPKRPIREADIRSNQPQVLSAWEALSVLLWPRFGASLILLANNELQKPQAFGMAWVPMSVGCAGRNE